MNLQVLGANRTRVNMDGNTVFFSYSTAVAVILKDGKGYRTEKYHSRTTEKHLTEFGLKSADTKPQAWFDDEGWTKPDAETLQLTRINSDMAKV